MTAPLLPFALTVGVTGHRLSAIPAERRAAVEGSIGAALAMIEAIAAGVRDRLMDTGLFDPLPAQLAIASPLADGADQYAAAAGLERGWSLNAILPFERGEYAADFIDEDPRETFETLLSKASRVLELPGDRAREAESYLLAGRATAAHSDLLIAVWDGAPPRGRGGTAEIVQLAVATGVPVLHFHSKDAREPSILWSGFDPHIVTRNGHDGLIRRPLTQENLQSVLDAVLSPPSDLVELRNLDDFRNEKSQRIRARIEYPLMLAVTGVRRIRPSHWSEQACIAASEQEWADFRTHCLGAGGAKASVDLIERAYCRSDRLASYYAQTFRSGHVFNFTLMATAALIGVSGFLWPGHQLALAAAEFCVAVLVIANTMVGTRRQWQRRWLDYRQLAERLRPIRSLMLLGVAAPDPPGSATDPIPRRWVDWYAAGIWRALGCPSGTIRAEEVPTIVTAIRTQEIESQVDYNTRAAQQAETLDRRLGKVFSFLFSATVAVSGAVVVGRWLAADWVDAHQNWLSLIAAGMPAIATAIFGIRSQGDFAGSAQRSQATAQTLTAIAAQLDAQKDDLARSADLVEQAARAMLVDLDEWRTVLKRSELEMA